MISLLMHDLELLFITPDKGRSLSTKAHNLRREMLPLGMTWWQHTQGCRLHGAVLRPCQHPENAKAFGEPTQFKLMVATFGSYGHKAINHHLPWSSMPEKQKEKKKENGFFVLHQIAGR